MRCRVFVTALLCGAALLLSSCGGASSSTTSPTPAPTAAYIVTSFVSSVTTLDGTPGTPRTGVEPSGTPNGPIVQAIGNSGVINGGSTLVRLTAATSFQVVYLTIGNVTGGVSGYWEVRLTAPSTDITLIVTLSRTLPVPTFNLSYAAGNSTGIVGSYQPVPTQVLSAATGDVQASVAWDTPTDVDLHVVAPTGEEVYFGNSSVSSGGALDLDSNPMCYIDGKNNENIRWSAGRAPAGTYIVRVDYFADCGVPLTNYVVTVNNGGNTQVFRGSFSGAGDAGGAGSGRTITTFTRGASLSPDSSPAFERFPLQPLGDMALRKLRLAASAVAQATP